MFYILGIITGLISSILILVIVSHFRSNIERTLNKTILLTQKKGEIILPPSEMEEFLLNNSNHKWSETNKLNIRKNQFALIRPWLWHSLEENKLVQVFLLNQKIENKE